LAESPARKRSLFGHNRANPDREANGGQKQERILSSSSPHQHHLNTEGKGPNRYQLPVAEITPGRQKDQQNERKQQVDSDFGTPLEMRRDGRRSLQERTNPLLLLPHHD
jgi:hypothetical protein